MGSCGSTSALGLRGARQVARALLLLLPPLPSNSSARAPCPPAMHRAMATRGAVAAAKRCARVAAERALAGRALALALALAEPWRRNCSTVMEAWASSSTPGRGGAALARVSSLSWYSVRCPGGRARAVLHISHTLALSLLRKVQALQPQWEVGAAAAAGAAAAGRSPTSHTLQRLEVGTLM